MQDNEFRTCVSCNQNLYLYDNFFIKRRHKDDPVRYDTSCKECRKEKNRAYREKNREKVRSKQREWDNKNREKIATSRKKRKLKLTVEELQDFRSRNDQAHYRMRERRIVAFLNENKTPPECNCGCGEHVDFDYHGNPNLFVNGHQNRGRSMPRTAFMAKRDLVDLQKFRDFIKDYRTKNGLTNAEVSKKGGWDPLYLDDVLYSKKRKYGIDKIEVDHFLRRLHGMAAPPTKWQLKQFEASNRAYRSTEPI